MGGLTDILNSDMPLVSDADGGGPPTVETTAPPAEPSAAPVEGLTAAPASEPPAGNTDPAAPPQPAHVPLGALQEERTRRQEAQARVQHLESQVEQMNQRWQQIMERMTTPPQQQQQEDPIPAFTDDPAEHIRRVTQQFEQQLNELRQQNQQLQQGNQQQVQQSQIINAATMQEASFRQSQPDYDNAFAFYANRRIAEAKAAGYTDQQAQQYLNNEILQLSAGQLQRQGSVPQAFYNLAKAMGYTGAAAPAIAAAPAAVPPTSLSTIPGNRQPVETGELTMEAVSNMTEAEFDQFWAKMERQGKQGPKY